ncbi:hypothetical protein GSY71_15660 [Pusillimonas sp. TS35]|uniref:hypothetical protein n=1 Tax=Paracandidimonas lactea TaxID=2895524 RepID=UPI001370011D|nr:hypothetical protein [Paracandidimonas lactea]MYN14575.1 hypothetical protein [Pusillimonas sp. TS35]
MAATDNSPLVFTPEELELLGQTADALSAYMGKPVLAEVMEPDETGYEWVLFAVPLDVQDDPADYVTVEAGGKNARLLGHHGGLPDAGNETYTCEYLWAIQLSDLEDARYIKVDQAGDEVAWTNNLQDILPFVMNEDLIQPDDDDDDDDDEEPDPPDDPGTQY